MTAVAIVAVIAVVAAGYLVQVRLFPWRDCPRCGGGRRNQGGIPGTHRDCGRCQATGRVRRWGAGRES